MVQAKQPFYPIGRKEGRNGGGVYVRGGGGTEERVLAERLEGEAAEESGGVVGDVPGAVIDVHGDEEDGDTGHGGGRDEPRRLGAVGDRLGQPARHVRQVAGHRRRQPGAAAEQARLAEKAEQEHRLRGQRAQARSDAPCRCRPSR